MIRSLKWIAGAIALTALLHGQAPAAKTKGKDITAMSEEGQLVWHAGRDDFGYRQKVYFMYSPGHGLSDIDFHPVTAREWKAMKSPTPDAVAYLQVVKETAVPQLLEVVRHIAEQGGYKTIVINVGQ